MRSRQFALTNRKLKLSEWIAIGFCIITTAIPALINQHKGSRFQCFKYAKLDLFYTPKCVALSFTRGLLAVTTVSTISICTM